MGEQKVQGHQNVQIQGIVGSRIEINYNGTTRTVPLEPAQIPVARRLRSPARLVRAHAGVVPYIDRADLLEDLGAWAGGAPPFEGQVVGGRGGSGKTRLAVELCGRLGAAGWLCGFLSRIADGEMLDALVNAPLPRLVVIDYAESRVEQLELLLPLLKAKASAQAPVRVLLLVRVGAHHASHLPERLRNRIDALDALLDECDLRVLEDTPLPSGDRVDLFEGAAAAFARRVNPSASVSPEQVDLDEEVFSNPLMIVIAAYLAVQDNAAPPTSRRELLEEVLAHERRYWRDSSAGLEADDVLLDRVVAMATLASAESESTAADLLRLLPDLADASAERVNRLARWVRSQYPGPRWWNPLEPDLLGEHLVATSFADQEQVLRGVLDRSDPDAVSRPLEVFSRAAGDHAGFGAALAPVLGSMLPSLCEVAVRQAETVKESDLLYGGAVTAAAALAAAAGAVPLRGEDLAAGVSLLPQRSDVVLNELAVVLSEREIQRRREDMDDQPGSRRDLGLVLNNLSNRLSDTGRIEEAMATAEEAVEIFRPLAASGSVQDKLNLAMSLNNRSNRLSDGGQQEEALPIIEESVEIYRSLVPGGISASRDWGLGLNNLSNRLSEAGRREEALEIAAESVKVFRMLGETDEHKADLAMALNNLSSRLAELGRPQEALAAIEEATKIRRVLASQHPAAHNLGLAMVLNNLSAHLAKAGKAEEALAAIEDAVKIFRPLAEMRPAAHDRHLASALLNLSNRYGETGNPERALAAIEESVESYRDLVAAIPGAHEPALALALNNQFGRLAEEGRYEDALPVLDEAVRIQRSLVAINADAHDPGLATVLSNLGRGLARQGSARESLEVTQEAVAVHRRLVSANPAAHRADLAHVLDNLADRYLSLDETAEALAAREEAVEVYRTLIQADADASWPDLGISLALLAHNLGALGRVEEGVAAAEEAVEIFRADAAESSAELHNLGIALQTLSQLLAEARRPEECIDVGEQAVRTYRALAEEEADVYLPRLADALLAFSSALKEVGRAEEARAGIEEAVGIYRSLGTDHPSQRARLVTALNYLDAILLGLGRTEAAAEVQEEAAALADRQEDD